MIRTRPRLLRLRVLTASALLCAPWSPHAENQVEIFAGHYRDNARLQAWTPSIAAAYDLGENAGFSAKYTFERFDKAAPATVVDAVSGATTVAGGSGGGGYTQDRTEGAASAHARWRETTLAAGYVNSHESDFTSDTYSMGISQELLEKNLTLGAQYALALDTIDSADPATASEFPHRKTSHSGTVGATQLLDARSLISGGYSVSWVSGYQNQPSRKIRIVNSVGGLQTIDIWPESHPDERLRQGLFARYKRFSASHGALDVNATAYTDDWGVRAAAIDSRYTQYLGARWLLRGRYRFYGQTAADFYRDTYSAYATTMSADTRLRAFNTHTAGIKLTYLMPSGQPGRPWLWAFAYNRYWEAPRGVAADIFIASIQIPY